VGENEKRDMDGNGESSAADEPTAIWDMEALRAAGLEDILALQQEEPAPRRMPSTAPVKNEPSVVLDEAAMKEAAEAAAAPSSEASSTPSSEDSLPAAPPPMRIGIESMPSRRYGWGVALGAGAAFFGVVYALIRFLM
jgi:hypothetical protein